MYQIKCSDGIQIQVIGKGENGLCRIVDHNGHVLLTAGYVECERWLAARGVRQHVGQ